MNKLFELLNKYARRDVITNKVFQILKNLTPTIKASPQLLDLFCREMLRYKQILKRPAETKKVLNAVSLAQISKLLDDIRDNPAG